MGCAISIDREPTSPKDKRPKKPQDEHHDLEKEKQPHNNVTTNRSTGGRKGTSEVNRNESSEEQPPGNNNNNNATPPTPKNPKAAVTGGSSDSNAPSNSNTKSNSLDNTPNGSGPVGATGGAAAAAVTEDMLQAIVGLENLRKFTYKEIHKATRKFSTKLGEGGFGAVYKGKIALLDPDTGRPREDGQQASVAVKLLDPDSHQGAHEWKTEVEHLAALKHRHVVRLLGYCQENNNWMLVYEFVPYGSFDYHIFAPDRPPVPFVDRLKVSLHAAKGLQYLHQNNIIYRDFKTSNILVDQEFNSKLADFGLARAGPGAEGTHVSTGIKGTMSYMAPEYISTGHLTQKCDVFSFGVVLLETLSGRPACNNKDIFGKDAPRLVDLAQQVGHNKARMFEILDPRLQDPNAVDGEPPRPGPDVPPKAFKIVLQAALFCIDRHAQVRPEMKTLVESLSVAHGICVRTAEMKAGGS